MKALILFLLVMVPFANCAAEAVYMQTDANGNVTYSDTPQNNAQPVALPPLSIAPGPQQPAQAKAAAATQTTTGQVAQASNPYVIFSLNSPADQESIQNQPTIPIDLKIDPPLQAGDTVQIYLDGAPWGPPAPVTHFVFNAPDRGTHTLSAKIINKDNQVLNETNSITIYVHQAHNGGAT